MELLFLFSLLMSPFAIHALVEDIKVKESLKGLIFIIIFVSTVYLLTLIFNHG